MAPERPAGGDLGSKLREARTRKGMSLREIADSTKISARVLESLERNDISRLPGGIFGRSFVRAFAIEVGLDPEAVIQEFITQFPFDSVTVGHPQSEQTEDNEVLESGRRIATTFIRLIAVSAVAAAVVVYFSLGRRPRPVPSSPADGLSTRPSAPIPTSAAGVGVLATDSESRVDRLDVTLSVSRPSWVTATTDGRTEVDRLLQPGDQARLDVRHELELKVANAEALTMTINGVTAKPLGDSGEVTTRLTPANFQAYLPAR